MSRVSVNTSDILHLVKSLNSLGHKVNGEVITIQNVIAGLLDLTQKTPEEIKKGALEELNNTHRFSNHGTSLYRDNVGTHQDRLTNIGDFCKAILGAWNKSDKRGTFDSDSIYPQNQDFAYTRADIDIDYFLFFLENHDIPEGILKAIGDISTTIKGQLDDKASHTLSQIEILGLDQIGYKGFKTSTNMYKKLRGDTESKSSIDAHIGSYLDKLDGLCACMLEVYQGNPDRIEPLRNYIKIFQTMSTKPIAHLVRDISLYARQAKKKGSHTVSDLFNINEILCLDGQDNQGINPNSRFPDTDQGDRNLDTYLRERFLGKGKKYLFREWTENALELNTHLDIPLFLTAWLKCQNKGIRKGPANDLKQQT